MKKILLSPFFDTIFLPSLREGSSNRKGGNGFVRSSVEHVQHMAPSQAVKGLFFSKVVHRLPPDQGRFRSP